MLRLERWQAVTLLVALSATAAALAYWNLYPDEPKPIAQKPGGKPAQFATAASGNARLD